MATVNAVLLMHALPVFVDSDIETFQIDARKVEQAITANTRAIMPVHLGGSAADLDTILDIAQKRGVPVIEDACQAHLAEWRGRKVGSYGNGLLQFPGQQEPQLRRGRRHPHRRRGAGRNLLSLPQQQPRPAQHRRRFLVPQHRRESPHDRVPGGAALAQMTRLEAQARTREENAAYLTSLLKEIPGITPARMYEGCTRNAYHLYMFRYDASRFSGLPRAAFLKALGAEGMPASGGYSPLNKEPFLEVALSTPGLQKLYSKPRLDIALEQNRCPENDRLCSEAIWLVQTMLLGPRKDMDDIAEAIGRCRRTPRNW